MLDLTIVRITYLQDDVVDGDITTSDVSISVVEELELHEAIELCRKEGVTFAATGNDWATLPDGSHTIDYGTGREEQVTIHPRGSWWPWEYAALVAGVDADHSQSLWFD
jgi:hypothetical protein